MSIEIPLEHNEHLIYKNEFRGERQTIPFVFAASNNSIFVSKEKHFAMEAWCFERVPIASIKRVLLRKERPLILWLTAGIIFLFGLTLSILMIIAFYSPEPVVKKISALPILITVFGAAMPFLAKNRQTLIVEKTKGKYKWKPKMQFEKGKREEVTKLQDEIIETCKSLGVQVNKD